MIKKILILLIISSSANCFAEQDNFERNRERLEAQKAQAKNSCSNLRINKSEFEINKNWESLKLSQLRPMTNVQDISDFNFKIDQNDNLTLGMRVRIEGLSERLLDFIEYDLLRNSNLPHKNFKTVRLLTGMINCYKSSRFIHDFDIKLWSRLLTILSNHDFDRELQREFPYNSNLERAMTTRNKYNEITDSINKGLLLAVSAYIHTKCKERFSFFKPSYCTPELKAYLEREKSYVKDTGKKITFHNFIDMRLTIPMMQLENLAKDYYTDPMPVDPSGKSIIDIFNDIF